MNEERRKALQTALNNLGQAQEIIEAVRQEERDTKRAKEADLYLLGEASTDITIAARRIQRVIERNAKGEQGE